MEQEFDDCYCPAGVVERQEARTVGIGAVIIGLLAAGVLNMVANFMKWIFSGILSIASATGSFLHQFAGMIVICSISIVFFLWIVADVYHWVTIARVPRWARPAVWIIKQIRLRLYRADLIKRFAERPELARKTIADVTADMLEHHDKEVSREQAETYFKVFKIIQANERIRNTRLEKYSA